MLKKIKFIIPLSLKVSLWYSTFIALLLALIAFASVFFITEMTDSVSKRSLVDEVNSKTYGQRAIFDSNRDYFDDGVYYSKYDNNGNLIIGLHPTGFTNQPIVENQVSEYATEDKTFYYYDVKTSNNEYLRGIIEVSALKDILFYIPIFILILSPFVLFLVVYVGYRIIKRALEPVRNMTETAEEISKFSNLSKRIESPKTSDEIADLAKTFNNMLVTLEASSEREKRFSSDVSHELRTPVSVIQAESEYASKYADSLEESKQSLEVIQRQAKRMTTMINQILEISRIDCVDSVDKEEVDLSSMLTNVSKDYVSLLTQNNLKLETNIEENLHIKANRDLIHRLIDNIFLNAVKFADSRIAISLRKDGHKIVVEIADDGIGIPDDQKEKVWDRFYKIDKSRTKTENQSSGLGLSISKKIVELHNGSITIKDNKPKGTIMQIVIDVKE